MKSKIHLNLMFFVLALLFAGCIKPKNEQPDAEVKRIEIEALRMPGMTDFELLQKMVDSLPENSTIQLADKVYTIDHTVIVTKSLNFEGPAILRRENQIAYSLKEPADENSTYLILDKTIGLRVPDRILLANGTAHSNVTSINIIIKISGDTVFLNRPIGRTGDQTNQFFTDTKLYKNINFFWILGPSEYPREKCSFLNISFDGNRANNTGSYSWTLNAAITALTKGPTVYRSCIFENSPGETIVGHNAQILSCLFKNLNGSGFHTSADRVYNREDEIHSLLTGNVFENTNQISTRITGHSEGAITHSNSGGYYTATYNKFINIGESVLGAFYPSLHQHDWGTSDIDFQNNIISTSGRMIYLIDTITAGEIKNVNIINNQIYEIETVDRSREINIRPGILLENEVNQ